MKRLVFFLILTSITIISCSKDKQPDEILQSNTWECTSYVLNGQELLNTGSNFTNLTWDFDATTLTTNSDGGQSVFNYTFNVETNAFSYSGYAGVVDTITESILKVKVTDSGNSLDASFVAQVQ